MDVIYKLKEKGCSVRYTNIPKYGSRQNKNTTFYA